MKLFVSDIVHDKAILDTVFEASQGAIEAIKNHGLDNVVNGAFGTYFKEDGTFLTFDTVYRAFDKVPDVLKAKYASSILGPPEFQDAIKDWLFKSAGLNVTCDIIATPGGTGALSSIIKNTLVPGQKVIHPNIGWGPYTTMAKEQRVDIANYELFNEFDTFNVNHFEETCDNVMQEQGKVLVFINDPCQNPTGYTMTETEWDQVIDVIKKISEKGPFILVHDIAYIDFNMHGDRYKKIFRRFTNLPKNILTVVTFSASKTLTAYGMRVGAQILISSNEEQRLKMKNACGNTARGVWSTINNGGMQVFSDIALNRSLKKQYMEEKHQFIELLNTRSAIFVAEAKEVNLPIYPYKEGFFITVRVDDQIIKNELHLKLKSLNIFFVNVFGGLRVAICSIPIDKIKGLAKRVKDALDECIASHEEQKME